MSKYIFIFSTVKNKITDTIYKLLFQKYIKVWIKFFVYLFQIEMCWVWVEENYFARYNLTHARFQFRFLQNIIILILYSVWTYNTKLPNWLISFSYMLKNSRALFWLITFHYLYIYFWIKNVTYSQELKFYCFFFTFQKL